MEINQNKCDGNFFCNCQRRYAETDPVSAEPMPDIRYIAKGDMRLIDGQWMICTDPEIGRWQGSGSPVSAEPVAYLDLGAGGYMDVGTDLTDEQLAALPKGRHMLAIVGTYGVEGFTAAPVVAQALTRPTVTLGMMARAEDVLNRAQGVSFRRHIKDMLEAALDVAQKDGQFAAQAGSTPDLFELLEDCRGAVVDAVHNADCHANEDLWRENLQRVDAALAQHRAAAQAQQPVSGADGLRESVAELLGILDSWHEDFPEDVGSDEAPVIERARVALAQQDGYKAAFHESVNSRLFLYEKALKEICNIQNLDIGGEWDEIEEARQIAKNALKEEI